LEGNPGGGHDRDAEVAGAGGDAFDGAAQGVETDVAGFSGTAPHLVLQGTIRLVGDFRQGGRKDCARGGIALLLGFEGGTGRGLGRVKQGGVFRLHLEHFLVLEGAGQFKRVPAPGEIVKPGGKDDGFAGDRGSFTAADDAGIHAGDIPDLTILPDEDIGAGESLGGLDRALAGDRCSFSHAGEALPGNQSGFANGRVPDAGLGFGETLDVEFAGGSGCRA
jgi:hypothetical protein